jgi:molecular chaperone GrpE (heat shock protein)
MGDLSGEFEPALQEQVTDIEQDDGGEELEETSSPSGGDPAGDGPDSSLETVLESLDSRLAEAQRLLARQSEMTERLHAENQGLRAGELRGAQLPLVRDLIRLCDDVERMHAVAGESAGDLTLVEKGLLDILARNGIEKFGVEQGEAFDPQLHAAAGVDRTEEEQLDRTVAEVVRSGFRWDSGDVIRVAEVRAYRYGGSS